MTDKPSVLFVCVHNAGRSQMAAGWLRHLAGDTVEIRSAGSAPKETPAHHRSDPGSPEMPWKPDEPVRRTCSQVRRPKMTANPTR